MLSLVFLFHALVEVQFGLTVLGRSNKKHPVFVIFSIFNNAKDKQSICFFVFFPSSSSVQRINNVERESDEQEGRQQMLRWISSFLSFLKKIV